MDYPFKYGKVTKNTVKILSPNEQYVYGSVKKSPMGWFVAIAADGKVLEAAMSTRGGAAKRVAEWGFDHISRV